MPKLDVSALESWLWETACVIRGPLDAPKFKDYILPLIFLKRLSDVFEDEVRHLAEEFGGRYNVSKLVEQDHKLVWFYIPEQARWSSLARKTSGLAFTEGDGRLRQFDLVTANPMWNQHFPTNTYEHDTYERFALGIPPGSSADWGWIQHMAASLKREGRMALVIDTGAVSRGSGNKGSNRERDIRREIRGRGQTFILGLLYGRLVMSWQDRCGWNTKALFTMSPAGETRERTSSATTGTGPDS